jgi:hypothetical protein
MARADASGLVRAGATAVDLAGLVRRIRRRPCPCPGCLPRGGYKVARSRRRFPYDEPPRPKSELMARLRTATPADEIIDVLCELGRGRRGGAEELAYLADHSDSDVRQTLESVLRAYRGREARRLRDRLKSSDSSESGLDNC